MGMDQLVCSSLRIVRRAVLILSMWLRVQVDEAASPAPEHTSVLAAKLRHMAEFLGVDVAVLGALAHEWRGYLERGTKVMFPHGAKPVNKELQAAFDQAQLTIKTAGADTDAALLEGARETVAEFEQAKADAAEAHLDAMVACVQVRCARSFGNFTCLFCLLLPL